MSKTKMNEKIIEKIIKAKGVGDVLGLLPSGWIGTSASNQEQANDAIGDMLRCDGRRLLYLVPLLGAVDLSRYMGDMSCEDCRVRFFGDTCPECERVDGEDEAVGFANTAVTPYPNLHWVIVGGNDRPMHPDWVRSIRDQCIESGVPFFFKQWGEYVPLCNLPSDCSVTGMKTRKNWHWFDGVPSEAVVRVGKKAAGRLLDDREWNEIPGLNENE